MPEVTIIINGKENKVDVNQDQLKDLENLVHSTEWEELNNQLKNSPYERKFDTDTFRITINGSGIGNNIFSNKVYTWGSDSKTSPNKEITSFFMQGNYFNEINYLNKIINLLGKIINKDRDNWKKGKEDTIDNITQFIDTL